MARGDRAKAIAFALSSPADRIGVGRLCQELLADLTGEAVVGTPCELLRLPRGGKAGGRPEWTEERRERFKETMRKKRERAA